MAVPNTKVSAYIPCYNNAATIAEAIRSLQGQTIKIDQIFVIDDGSTDNSAEIAGSCGVEVIRNDKNSGRGAIRAQAMQFARNEFVLSLDASKVISPLFLEHALVRFTDNVAAVYGRIILNHAENTTGRWANRHIYNMCDMTGINRYALLVTAGCILRRSMVLQIGNFNSSYTHSEDRELGFRLLANKYEVVFDPALQVVDARRKNLAAVLETYWRWHAGALDGGTFLTYLKQIAYSIKVLAVKDLQEGDPAAGIISLISPHYQWWRHQIWRLGKKGRTK